MNDDGTTPYGVVTTKVPCRGQTGTFAVSLIPGREWRGARLQSGTSPQVRLVYKKEQCLSEGDWVQSTSFFLHSTCTCCRMHCDSQCGAVQCCAVIYSTAATAPGAHPEMSGGAGRPGFRHNILAVSVARCNPAVHSILSNRPAGTAPTGPLLRHRHRGPQHCYRGLPQRCSPAVSGASATTRSPRLLKRPPIFSPIVVLLLPVASSPSTSS